MLHSFFRAFLLPSLLLLAGLLSFPVSAADAVPGWKGSQRIELGRTDEGRPLVGYADQDALVPASGSPLIVVTFSSAGDSDVADERWKTIAAFRNQLESASGSPLRLVAIPLSPSVTFPPQGPAYHTKENRTAATLWRALAWLGADAVIEFTSDNAEKWPDTSLAAAARTHSVAGMGTIPTARLKQELLTIPIKTWTAEQKAGSRFDELVPFLSEGKNSPLREEFQRRFTRTPEQVATQLTKVYGHDLKKVMYQPALAIIARRQFLEAQGDKTVREDIARILKPWLETSGEKVDGNGSVVSGHLVFADWALATKDPRAVERVRRAADVGFDADGKPLPAMPSHNEMSDAVFMGCPILTSAARLTGEAKYLDQMVRHFEFMKKLDLRADGLYRHSPLDEAAWGRGNGFPMLGLSLALTDLQAIRDDASQPAALRKKAGMIFDQILPDFLAHARALVKHQDATGLWRQVVDEPSAYREMTATCMTGFALQRGLNNGWLDATEFRPVVDRAWAGVLPRISADGSLIDVCTGTGKQKSLQDYYDRAAILGVDERGGAMALIFAVERTRIPKK